MDPGLEHLFGNSGADTLSDADPNQHAGLDLAGAFARITKGDIKSLMSVMKCIATDKNVQLHSETHKGLLVGPEIVEIINPIQRQQYFRMLYLLCLENK